MQTLQSTNPAELGLLIPLPCIDDHKYSRGVCTVVGGSASYPGAACMAACAAQRAGAGYTQVFCAPESVDAVRFGHSSLVVRSWEDAAFDLWLTQAAHHVGAVVLGCGLDAARMANGEVVPRVLESVQLPLVVDGGALSQLAALPASLRHELCEQRLQQGFSLVLTPHAGEAARLAAACKVDAADAPELAARLARAYGATVVLKGAATFISDGETCYRMDAGTPALAKAGTGDVLAGVIGALLAQGVLPVDAGRLGAALHAQAGVLAAQARGVTGVIPEDVIDAIPAAVQAFLAAAKREMTR